MAHLRHQYWEHALDEGGASVPIRDHVTMVRLAVAALLVVLNVWRMLDGR